MEAGRLDSDIIVIGGGPAGSAAAITAAAAGLRVRLLERRAVMEEHPGETLHPGVESVLEQLGVAGRLPAVTGSRHPGIRIRWGDSERFEAYGSDLKGPWSGFQVSRAGFDTMLLDRARELGVTRHHSCTVQSLLQAGGRTIGVRTSAGDMTATQVIDATGRTPFPGAGPGTGRTAYSPVLIARYGYGTGSLPELDAAPILKGDATGWLWTAMVRPGLYQWTQVALDGSKRHRDWRPTEFGGLVPRGHPRAADVTWRLSRHIASAGWFQVGDAAAVLDPTSANGVLRALLSGLIAAKLACSVISGAACESEAGALYVSWLTDWFFESARTLSRFYSDLGVAGFDESRIPM